MLDVRIDSRCSNLSSAKKLPISLILAWLARGLISKIRNIQKSNVTKLSFFFVYSFELVRLFSYNSRYI